MLTFLPTISRPLDPLRSLPLKSKPRLTRNPLLLPPLKLLDNNPPKTSSSAPALLVFLSLPSELNRRPLSFLDLDPRKSTESAFNSVRSTSSMATSPRSVNKSKVKLRLSLNNSSRNPLKSSLNLSPNSNNLLKRPLLRNNLNKLPLSNNNLNSNSLNSSSKSSNNNTFLNNKCSTSNTRKFLKAKITLASLNPLTTLSSNPLPSPVTVLPRLTERTSNNSNTKDSLNRLRTLNSKLLLPPTKPSSNRRLSPPLTSNNPVPLTLLLPLLNNNKFPLLNLLTQLSTRSLNNNNKPKHLSVRLLPTTRVFMDRTA